MADPFLAEIRIFPFNFPPKGWATCDGQLLPLSQNTALFSLLGTFYGGDGKSTFALPNLQGNAPMQPGQGAGLSLRDLGEMSGTQTVTLLQAEMPAHTHLVSVNNGSGTSGTPSNRFFAEGKNYSTSISNPVAMGLESIAPAGGSLAHNNMQPYLKLNFCIAMVGDFPPRP